jgi:hypothetical protein
MPCPPMPQWANAAVVDVGSQSADTIKLNFIPCVLTGTRAKRHQEYLTDREAVTGWAVPARAHIISATSTMAEQYDAVCFGHRPFDYFVCFCQRRAGASSQTARGPLTHVQTCYHPSRSTYYRSRALCGSRLDGRTDPVLAGQRHRRRWLGLIEGNFAPRALGGTVVRLRVRERGWKTLSRA